MKKIGVLFALIIVTSTIFIGCSLNSKYYSENEDKIIDFSNEQIEKIYKVKIDKSNYYYSVGKRVSDNEYKKIYSSDDPRVIAVTGKFLNKSKMGDVVAYSFIYDTKSNEVISSRINKKE